MRASGGGRPLKCDQFPEMVAILEFAFGERDKIEFSGGGMKCHSRLTEGTLYRAADNATTMKAARELLLASAPKDFNISLSTCYNYTVNFKSGTHAAQQHHEGKDINAAISLQPIPRIAVHQMSLNIHWTSANVNYSLDNAAANPNTHLVDSKDAKAVVLGDVRPVQLPGKSWKKTEYPDHD